MFGKDTIDRSPVFFWGVSCKCQVLVFLGHVILVNSHDLEYASIHATPPAHQIHRRHGRQHSRKGFRIRGSLLSEKIAYLQQNMQFFG